MPQRLLSPASDAVSREELRDAYLQCRTWGHGWSETVRSDLQKPDYGWRLTLRCERCTCERHDIIDPVSGDLIPNGRRYFHPDGYELDEKFSRSEFRQEWARRNRYVAAKTNRKR